MAAQTEQDVRQISFMVDFFTDKIYELAASESPANAQFSQAFNLIPITSMPIWS